MKRNFRFCLVENIQNRYAVVSHQQQLINVPDAVYCRGAEWYPTVQYSKEERKLPTHDAS